MPGEYKAFVEYFAAYNPGVFEEEEVKYVALLLKKLSAVLNDEKEKKQFYADVSLLEQVRVFGKMFLFWNKQHFISLKSKYDQSLLTFLHELILNKELKTHVPEFLAGVQYILSLAEPLPLSLSPSHLVDTPSSDKESFIVVEGAVGRPKIRLKPLIIEDKISDKDAIVMLDARGHTKQQQSQQKKSQQQALIFSQSRHLSKLPQALPHAIVPIVHFTVLDTSLFTTPTPPLIYSTIHHMNQQDSFHIPQPQSHPQYTYPQYPNSRQQQYPYTQPQSNDFHLVQFQKAKLRPAGSGLYWRPKPTCQASHSTTASYAEKAQSQHSRSQAQKPKPTKFWNKN